MPERVLALVPARGGSKGLAGKNLRLLAGLPLIEHSIRLAALAPEIARTVVTTDDEEIAVVARAAGADVPFVRPAELAGDETAMWPVVRHALAELRAAGDEYDVVVMLDPTSPGRLPSDVTEALRRLRETPAADGVVAVSRPPFNPIWTAVVERDGFMAHLVEQGTAYHRRQDVPDVFRINAVLYAWRTDFVERETESWFNGRNLLLEVPESRALHIDDLDELRKAELVIGAGLVRLPWLER